MSHFGWTSFADPYRLPGRNLLDHLGHRDVVVGRDDPEALHIATEEFGLLRGEGPPRRWPLRA